MQWKGLAAVLIVVHLVIVLFPSTWTEAQIPGGDPEITIKFDVSERQVNGTPGSNPTAVFPGRVSIGNPPAIEGRRVIVNLTATLDGGIATVNPSTLILTKDSQDTVFVMEVRVNAPPGWESIEVNLSGTWRYVPGVRSGEIQPITASIVPLPYSYIEVSGPDEVSLNPGVEGRVVLTARNVGSVEGGVWVALENEDELRSEGVDVGEFNGKWMIGPKEERRIEVPVRSGGEGDYRMVFELHTWGEEGNATYMVAPSYINVSLHVSEEVSLYSRVRVSVSDEVIRVKVGEVGRVRLYFVNDGNVDANVRLRVENLDELKGGGIEVSLSRGALSISPGGSGEVILTVEVGDGAEGNASISLSFENVGDDEAEREVNPASVSITVEVLHKATVGADGEGVEGGGSGKNITAIAATLAIVIAVLIGVYALVKRRR